MWMDIHLWIAVNYIQDKSRKTQFDQKIAPDEKHFFLCNGKFLKFAFILRFQHRREFYHINFISLVQTEYEFTVAWETDLSINVASEIDCASKM